MAPIKIKTHGWRVRSMAGAAVCALSCSAAWAQATAAQTAPAQGGEAAPASVAEVVVTGTNIRGAAPVGSPIIGVTRRDIEQTGATTVSQILQLQPQILNFGITDTSRAGNGGAGNITYASSINLRGLSPFATLTLFDGFRVNPAGTLGTAVDPNSIPSIFLQRVDVVADGASATYGSDAIAGVVNLIPRRSFEGAMVQGRGGWADHYDEHQFDALLGHNWGVGQLTVGLEYTYNSALNGQDRSYYNSDLRSHGYPDLRVNNCSPGTIIANGTTYAIPASGVTSATASSLVPGTKNLCDPLKSGDLLPQQRRYNAALTFNQDITPWAHVFVDAVYANRQYQRKVPFPNGPLTVTSANPYYVAAPGNTTGTETVDYWFGNQALGNTWTSRGSSESYNIIGGFKFDLPHDWNLQVSGAYGHDHDQDVDIQISASTPQVAAALASTNPATALNLFGPSSPAVLQSVYNDLFGAPGWTSMTDFQVKADGPVLTLPGGVVKAAAGFENHYDTVMDGVVLGTVQSNFVGFGGYQHLTRTWNSAYGELLIPFVGSANSLPGVKAFDVDVAYRWTEYTVVGSTTNPKVGVNWTVADGFKLHGSWGTSFRAPALSELVGPLVGVFFQTYSTPNGPAPGYATAGGNLNLKPESATTWSIGADWTPPSVQNLKLSVNYYNINYTNQINAYLSNLNILQNPTAYGSLITYCPSAACAAMIQRYVTGPNAYPVFGPVLNQNQIAAFVNGQEQNLGTTLTDGLDFDAGYRIPGTSVGDFDLGISGSYVLSFRQAYTPGAPLLNVLNTITNPLRLRLRGRAGWTRGPWDVTAFVNYENAYTNNNITPTQTVGAWTTVDLHLGYRLDALNPWLSNSHLRLDITNLFDSDPPFVAIIPNASGGGGFDPNLASPIGRIVAVTFDKKF